MRTERERQAKVDQATNWVPTFFRAGELFVKQKQFDDALAQLDTALQYKPDHADARLLKGQVLIIQRRFADAKIELGLYLTLKPHDKDAAELADLCARANPADTTSMAAFLPVFLRQKDRSLAESIAQSRDQLLIVYRQRIDTAWPGMGKQLTMTPDGNCGLNLLYCLRQRTDLAPLEGLPLTWLCLEGCTGVESVIPLRGMPLRYLNLWNTSVSDVTPLEWMTLEEITLDTKTRWHGMDVLRRMKSLKFINLTFDKRLPAEEFWKKYDAGEINR
jgi:Tetratricopeptide repeat